MQFALSYAHAMKNLQQGYIVIRETMRKFIQKEIDEKQRKNFPQKGNQRGTYRWNFLRKLLATNCEIQMAEIVDNCKTKI